MRAISNKRRRCPFCMKVVNVAYNLSDDPKAPIWTCGQGECPPPPKRETGDEFMARLRAS